MLKLGIGLSYLYNYGTCGSDSSLAGPTSSSGWLQPPLIYILGPTSYSAYYNYDLTNPQKGIWSFTIPDMINPQKGIDLMNNTSIIIRILFAVTLFQHSPLTRRVFYNNIRREREGATTSTTYGTLTGISINHRKFFSSSSFSAWSWSSIIILIRMRLKYHNHLL